MNLLFKPHYVSEDFWKKLLRKVEEISSCEKVECDICLIGSHARGDASPISDVDLVLFAEGESNLKQTELFYIDETMVTIFPVNAETLLRSESTDFYNTNNPFEAKLLEGNGKILDALRKGVFGKRIDLDATKKVTGRNLVTNTFGEHVKTMVKVAEKITGEVRTRQKLCKPISDR